MRPFICSLFNSIVKNILQIPFSSFNLVFFACLFTLFVSPFNYYLPKDTIHLVSNIFSLMSYIMFSEPLTIYMQNKNIQMTCCIVVLFFIWLSESNSPLCWMRPFIFPLLDYAHCRASSNCPFTNSWKY